MKKLLLFTFLTASIYAGFDFKTCSGSGTFEQQINHYHGNYENAITIGTIPKGIQGLKINLISDKDVDIRLYAENGDKIVHWPQGILNKSYLETKPYKNINITYSGYNGINGEKGDELIEVNGTLPTTMIMKAFGYQAGYATVNYSWTGKEGCKSTQNGSGTFTQKIFKNKTNLVGTIPTGIENLNIKLTSDKDLDIQLYGKDGTAIVSWKPRGLIFGPNEQNITHHKMDIFWSGYNGTQGKKGHEYIKIPNKTTEVLTMKVFGYEAGDANVTYSWGHKGTCIEWYDGCNNCTLTDNNQTSCTEIYCEVYGEYKCTKWKDDNTSKPNSYVCGANTLIDCPEENQTCNLRTFKNLDELNKNVTYTFQYNGKCKKDNNLTNAQQAELTKNIHLWNKEINGSNYQFSVDGFFSYGPNKWSTIVKDGKATVLSGKIKIGGPKTIIGHFNFIQSLIDDDDIKLTKVTYDSTYGYPTEIKWSAVDQEIVGLWGSYKINNFKLLNNNSVCTEEYLPVCGANLNLPIVPSPTQTFGNICKLENAKFTLLHSGKCYVPYETNITIKPKKIDCVTSTFGPTKCMQIQEEGSNIWDSVYFIDNFDYQENYQYNVHVKITKENNTMLVGVPFKTYKAIKIIKKELVDDNSTICTEEYAPVCGKVDPCHYDPNATGPQCLMLPYQQTFGNLCKLQINKFTTFLHDGVCKKDDNLTNVQQAELTKNIHLWNKEINGSNYQFSVTYNTLSSGKESNWTTIVKEGNATILSGEIQIGKPKTIIGHFNFIQSIIDDENRKLTKITYDQTYGYPTEIEWSAVDTNIIGIWGNYKIHKFKLLDSSGMCMTIVDPVCAQKKYAILPQTYSNACFAKLAGATVLYKGACTNSYEKNITIKSKKVDCVGLFVAPDTKCLNIQEEGSNIWETILDIKNFTYQENYTYKVFAKITKNNLNITDVPGKSYELIKIIKKEPVENNETVCTEEYTPVCGITNPCPKGAQCFVSPIYKTFKNMCKLNVSKAKFAYEGECNSIQTKKEIIYVKEDTPVCIAMVGVICPMYFTRKSITGSWEDFYKKIEGFEKKAHYRYKLSIDMKDPSHPKLLNILEKEFIVPKSCVAWFDGCNECTKKDIGVICTDMACIEDDLEDYHDKYKCHKWEFEK